MPISVTNNSYVTVYTHFERCYAARTANKTILFQLKLLQKFNLFNQLPFKCNFRKYTTLAFAKFLFGKKHLSQLTTG